MLIRVSCLGGQWRRVKSHGRLTTWDFIPGGGDSPDIDTAINCLLGALLRTGTRATLNASVESDEVHAALFTVILQTVASTTEVYA